jgi:DNA excision repair protein ERCC-4
LRTLRSLAEYLLCFDAVTFLAYLESLRAGESINSVWLFHESAHTIFEQA